MATPRIYRFEERKYPLLFSHTSDEVLFSLKDIKGMSYSSGIQHLNDSLNSLIKQGGTQKEKFDKHGYLVVLSGSYGAGKTTATEALRNELQKTHGEKLTSMYYSFLPFSNPNEAISVFLNTFGENLWRCRLADIRDDIQQFILEVTPETTERPRVGMGLGGLSISWPIIKPKVTYKTVVQRMAKKMTGLAQANHTIVIILDDLDRLEPTQIVALMRMAEKLRRLPRVLIIVPIYKEIIRNAFVRQLDIDSPNGSALLRKLIDFEVKLQNPQSDLESVFKQALTESSGMKLAEEFQDKCWYTLLHNIVIAEAYDLAKDEPGGYEKIVLLEKSPYIREIRKIFGHHIHEHRKQAEPSLTEFENGKYFAPLGKHYQTFYDMNDKEMSPRQLSELRNHDNVMKRILTDKSIVDSFKAQGQDHGYPEFKASIEQRSSEPALTNFFIPMLREFGKNEPFLVNNYKLRDMAVLARAIGGSRKFDTATRDVGKLYDLIREEYDNFR